MPIPKCQMPIKSQPKQRAFLTAICPEDALLREDALPNKEGQAPDACPLFIRVLTLGCLSYQTNQRLRSAAEDAAENRTDATATKDAADAVVISILAIAARILTVALVVAAYEAFTESL